MTQINQVVVSATPGDAVTNSALEIRTLLRRLGPSEIYARYVDPRLSREVLSLHQYGRRHRPRPADDLILYHGSIGEPSVFAFIADRPERVVLVYHNISPPEPFLPYDPAFAGLLTEGRRELAGLRNRVVLALAVSAFNAAELVQLGYEDVRVSPLIVDVASLGAVEPDEATAHHLATRVDGPVVLFVGQLFPHKRPDVLLQSYHAMVTAVVPEANLVIVGPARLPRYRDALQLYISEMNLTRAWMTGPVSLEQLVAFYRAADVFATASEHEGFCVPLLEAMTFRLPIVARANAALPDTLGDAGLLLPGDAGPLLMGEAMAEVATNPALARSLVAHAPERLARFDPDQARATLLEHLLSIA